MRELRWTVVGDGDRGSTAGPRLGVLSVPGAGDGRDEPVRIATPACLTYTRRGEPAHLTPDVLATLPPEARAFQVSLAHFMDHLPPSHVSNCPGGGRAYFGSAPTGGAPVQPRGGAQGSREVRLETPSFAARDPSRVASSRAASDCSAHVNDHGAREGGASGDSRDDVSRDDATRRWTIAKMGSGAHHPLSRPRRERGRSGLDGRDETRFTNLFELADAHLAHLLQALALRLRGRGMAGGVSATLGDETRAST